MTETKAHASDPRLLRAPRTMPEGRFATIAWPEPGLTSTILGAEIAVRTMDIDLLEALLDQMSATTSPIDHGADDDRSTSISILDRGPASKRRYAVYSGRARVGLAKDATTVHALVMDALPFVASTASPQVVLRGALVGSGSDRLLLAGRWGPAARRLVAALTDDGVPCAAEVLGVATHDGTATMARLPRLVDGSWIIDDDEPGPVTVRGVATLIQAAEGELEVSSLRPAECLVALCEQALNLRRLAQEGLDGLADLVDGAAAGCWRVRFDPEDLGPAVSEIRSLLAQL